MPVHPSLNLVLGVCRLFRFVGFGVCDLGFRVWDLGSGIQGLGFKGKLGLTNPLQDFGVRG